MSAGESRYALLAARLLRNEQAPPSTSNERRDAIVAAMTLAIAAKARRRRIVLATGLALAAAASIVWVVRATHVGGQVRGLVVENVVGGGSVLVRGEETQPLAERNALTEGDVVRANQDSGAALRLGQDTRLTLSSAAELRVDELGATRRFSLASGRLQARVAKLGPGERFLVKTPDSEVEVRGTVFVVSVGKAKAGCREDASQSTVEVSEGAVWVRSGGREVLLHPGDSFTAPCAGVEVGEAAAEASAPAVEKLPLPAPARPAWRHAAATSITGSRLPLANPRAAAAEPAPSEAPSAVEPVSSLAEQNDLLSTAMAAERRGQHDLALRQLDDLIRRFPSGPLRESAQAERQRILSAQSPR